MGLALLLNSQKAEDPNYELQPFLSYLQLSLTCVAAAGPTSTALFDKSD